MLTVFSLIHLLVFKYLEKTICNLGFFKFPSAGSQEYLTNIS